MFIPHQVVSFIARICATYNQEANINKHHKRYWKAHFAIEQQLTTTTKGRNSSDGWCFTHNFLTVLGVYSVGGQNKMHSLLI